MDSVPFDDACRASIRKCLSPWIGAATGPTARLPFPRLATLDASAPPNVRRILLPSWANEVAVDGSLLVPSCAVVESHYEQVDWELAAFWFVQGVAERGWERKYGTVHSYGFRLVGWDPSLWTHAWANRIAIFLRLWSAHSTQRPEAELFGARPNARLIVTHDVDAVKKTAAIRAKQSAFQVFKAVRSVGRGQVGLAARSLGRGIQFFAGQENYWSFPRLMREEQSRGMRSHFNFYGAKHRRGKEHLLDPSYDVAEPHIVSAVQELAAGGWTVGLHQAYNSWESAGRMAEERERVEKSAGREVTSCRQHWLRFSWEKTWAAQSAAGLRQDTTLGFNDRPGFRNGAALASMPFDPWTCRETSIETLPMILMDSHLYDYEEYSPESRRERIASLCRELKATGGTATAIWHTQVLGNDYRWGDGYIELLDHITQWGLS